MQYPRLLVRYTIHKLTGTQILHMVQSMATSTITDSFLKMSGQLSTFRLQNLFFNEVIISVLRKFAQLSICFANSGIQTHNLKITILAYKGPIYNCIEEIGGQDGGLECLVSWLYEKGILIYNPMVRNLR